MAGVNKAILLGHLGKDPEMKIAQSGKAVTRFSFATSEKWSGEDKTEWHSIVCFDRLAEIANQYLKKGSMLYIEGRIQTRSWDDQNGNKRYTTEIIANSFQMLGSANRKDLGEYSSTPESTRPKTKAKPMEDDPFSGDFGPPPTDDDLPF